MSKSQCIERDYIYIDKLDKNWYYIYYKGDKLMFEDRGKAIFCLVSTLGCAVIATASAQGRRYKQKSVIEIALEADAHIDIMEESVTSIEIAAKEAVIDNEQHYLLNFYYNYKLKDMPITIPAFEIIYSVDKETYDEYSKSFNKASLSKRAKMVDELAGKYDPIQVYDHILEDTDVFAQ